MRILLIHNRYGKFSGEEAVLEADKSLLEQKGNNVLVYSKTSEDISGFVEKANAFFSGFHNFQSNLEVEKILLKFKPELVHVHNLYPLISPSILTIINRNNIPIVMTVHNYRLICPNGLLFTDGSICERCENGKEWNCILKNCEGSLAKSSGYALRNIYSRKRKLFSSNISKFICLTYFQKQKLIKNGFDEKKLEVLPNYLDPSLSADNLSSSNNYIAFSGRINKQKGFDIIIRAMDLIKSESNSNGLPMMLAAGNIDSSFINQYKIPDNIEIIGELPNEKMEEFYLNAQFLVFSSRSYEGAPIVFLEAMKYKLPVIAPRLGAYPEIIEDGINGLLFTPGDHIDLSRKILTLKSDIAFCQALGNEGNKKLKERFSSDAHYKNLIKIYNSLKK